ncbi:hypothetical protein I4U23_005148 [Adineta vaga]|nr:hypothetical protein I4U23_005148 [Adineta vaga]
MKVLVVLLLLSIDVLLAQDAANSTVGISSAIVIRPRSMSIDFWTQERMKAAKEPTIVPPKNSSSTGRAMSISTGPQLTVPGHTSDTTSPLARALNARGRYVATTGDVIPSTSGDLVVTAGHCVYDTTASQWLTSCNWIFVPGYENGNAPYGRWPARQVAALNLWTRSNPNFNYDVAFVALSQVNGKHITQVTGSQSLGFNYPRNQPTYAFGYPVNLAKGEVLQLCKGTTSASKYTANSYIGQGLSNCYMAGGCSGGPWLQQFNEATGVGVTYSVNSFTYTLAPNTINGPVFDSNIQTLWNYMTAR